MNALRTSIDLIRTQKLIVFKVFWTTVDNCEYLSMYWYVLILKLNDEHRK